MITAEMARHRRRAEALDNLRAIVAGQEGLAIDGAGAATARLCTQLRVWLHNYAEELPKPAPAQLRGIPGLLVMANGEQIHFTAIVDPESGWLIAQPRR